MTLLSFNCPIWFRLKGPPQWEWSLSRFTTFTSHLTLISSTWKGLTLTWRWTIVAFNQLKALYSGQVRANSRFLIPSSSITKQAQTTASLWAMNLTLYTPLLVLISLIIKAILSSSYQTWPVLRPWTLLPLQTNFWISKMSSSLITQCNIWSTFRVTHALSSQICSMQGMQLLTSTREMSTLLFTSNQVYSKLSPANSHSRVLLLVGSVSLRIKSYIPIISKLTHWYGFWIPTLPLGYMILHSEISA